MANNGFISFMMGSTGAGLFRRVRRPGAPTEFIDSRTVEEYLASGEFEETLSRYGQGVTRAEATGPGSQPRADRDLWLSDVGELLTKPPDALLNVRLSHVISMINEMQRLLNSGTIGGMEGSLCRSMVSGEILRSDDATERSRIPAGVAPRQGPRRRASGPAT
jgi:hypothetical protein